MFDLQLVAHPYIIDNRSADSCRQQQICHICKRGSIPHGTHPYRKRYDIGCKKSIGRGKRHLEHISASRDVYEYRLVFIGELPVVIQPCKTVDEPPASS